MMVVSIIIILLCLLLPIAIISIIVSAIVKRNKEEKSDFENTIRGIYSYSILILSLFAIIIGTIVTFRVGLDVILPEESTSSYSSSYNNDEKERNENIVECLTNMSIVISCIPIFIYHNKLTKKIRETKNIENK